MGAATCMLGGHISSRKAHDRHAEPSRDKRTKIAGFWKSKNGRILDGTFAAGALGSGHLGPCYYYCIIPFETPIYEYLSDLVPSLVRPRCRAPWLIAQCVSEGPTRLRVHYQILPSTAVE